MIGALQCLCVMTASAAGVRKSMAEQGVLRQLVHHLGSQSLEIKYWSSELVGNMSTSGTVRRTFRKKGGKAFLNASSHLYKRPCPSVRPFVTRFFFQNRENACFDFGRRQESKGRRERAVWGMERVWKGGGGRI